MIRLFIYGITVTGLLFSCHEPQSHLNQTPSKSTAKLDSIESTAPKIGLPKVLPVDYDTTMWTEITAADDVIIELRYASTDNFTESQIYPCARCFLRPSVANRLLSLNQKIKKEKKFKFKLFDCYRPRPAQQRLWDKHPNATHVTHPTKGSMHNRGAAVDLTLVSIDSGEEIDMGTDFDFFGKEARHDYISHSESIRSARYYLKGAMEQAGFKSIKSEWWHYSLSGQGSALSSWEWECPE